MILDYRNRVEVDYFWHRDNTGQFIVRREHVSQKFLDNDEGLQLRQVPRFLLEEALRCAIDSYTHTNSTTGSRSTRSLNLHSQPVTSDPPSSFLPTQHISSLPRLGFSLCYTLLHISVTGPIKHRRTR